MFIQQQRMWKNTTLHSYLGVVLMQTQLRNIDLWYRAVTKFCAAMQFNLTSSVMI